MVSQPNQKPVLPARYELLHTQPSLSVLRLQTEDAHSVMTAKKNRHRSKQERPELQETDTFSLCAFLNKASQISQNRLAHPPLADTISNRRFPPSKGFVISQLFSPFLNHEQTEATPLSQKNASKLTCLKHLFKITRFLSIVFLVGSSLHASSLLNNVHKSLESLTEALQRHIKDGASFLNTQPSDCTASLNEITHSTDTLSQQLLTKQSLLTSPDFDNALITISKSIHVFMNSLGLRTESEKQNLPIEDIQDNTHQESSNVIETIKLIATDCQQLQTVFCNALTAFPNTAYEPLKQNLDLMVAHLQTVLTAEPTTLYALSEEENTLVQTEHQRILSSLQSIQMALSPGSKTDPLGQTYPTKKSEQEGSVEAPPHGGISSSSLTTQATTANLPTGEEVPEILESSSDRSIRLPMRNVTMRTATQTQLPSETINSYCASFANELRSIATHFRALQELVFWAANLEPLALHSAYVARAKKSIEFLLTDFKNLDQHSWQEFTRAYTTTPKNEKDLQNLLSLVKIMTPKVSLVVQSTQTFLTCFGTPPAIELLPTLPFDDELSGCERLAIAAEDLALLTQTLDTTFQTLARRLVQLPPEDVQEDFLIQIQEIANRLNQFVQPLLSCFKNDAFQNLCRDCCGIATNEKRAVALWTGHNALNHCSYVFSDPSSDSLLTVLKAASRTHFQATLYHLAQQATPLVDLIHQVEHCTEWTGTLSPTLESSCLRCTQIHQHLRGATVSFVSTLSSENLTPEYLTEMEALAQPLKMFIDALQDVWNSIGKDEISTLAFTLPHITSFYRDARAGIDAWKALLHTLKNSLRHLVSSVQMGDIRYAYHPGMLNMISAFNRHSWLVEWCRIIFWGANSMDPSCKTDDLSQTIDQIKNDLETLLELLTHPTCFKELEAAGQTAALQASLILQQCDAFTHLLNSTTEIKPPLTTFVIQLTALLPIYGQLLQTLQELTSPSKLTFEILQTLAQSVQTFTQTFWTPLAASCNTLLQDSGVPAQSRPKATWLPPLTLGEQVLLQQQALSRLAIVIEHIARVAQSNSVIPYPSSFVDTLTNAIQALDRPLQNLLSLSEMPTYTLWTPFIPALTTAIEQATKGTVSLRRTLTDLRREIVSKCCTQLHPKLMTLLATLQVFSSNLVQSVIQNPLYASYLYSSEDQHAFLVALGHMILPKVQTQLKKLETMITRLTPQNTEFFCFTPQILPILDQLISIAQEATIESQAFCERFGLIPNSIENIIVSDFTTFEDFWHAFLEVFHSIQTVLSVLNDLNEAGGYTINPEYIVLQFQGLSNTLKEVAKTLLSLTTLPSNLVCWECGAWPHTHIKTLCLLLDETTKLLTVDVSSSNCCQKEVDELSFLFQRISSFVELQDFWLGRIEQEIIQSSEEQRTLEKTTAVQFIETLQALAPRFLSIASSIQSLFQRVADYRETNHSSSCIASSCIAMIRETHTSIAGINQSILANFTASEHASALQIVRKTAEITMFSSSCENRLHLVSTIFQVAQKGFSRWETFQFYWNLLNHLPNHRNLETAFDLFATNLCKLRQTLTMGESVYQVGLSHFCPFCSSEAIILEELTHIPSEDSLILTFQALKTKANSLCPSHLELDFQTLQNHLKWITVFTHCLRTAPESMMQLVSQNGASSFASLLVPLETLTQQLAQGFPLVGDCLSDSAKMFFSNTTEALKQIRKHLQSMVVTVHQKDNRLVLLLEDEKTFEVSLVSSPLGALQDLSKAWFQFCRQWAESLPDSFRPCLLPAALCWERTLQALLDQLKTFTFPSHLMFCSGKTLNEIVGPLPLYNAQVLDLISATHLLVQSLRGNNCCDAHARCIYGIVLRLVALQHAWKHLPGETFLQALVPQLLHWASLLDRLHDKLFMEILKTPSNECTMQVAQKEFADLETSFQGLIDQACSMENPLSVSTEDFVMADWNAFSFSARNDCDYLPELYGELLKKCSNLLTLVLSKSLQASSETITDVLDGCKTVQASLERFLQTFPERRPLCHACQTEALCRPIQGLVDRLSNTALVLRASLFTSTRDLLIKTTEASAAFFDLWMTDTTRPVGQIITEFLTQLSRLTHHIQDFNKECEKAMHRFHV